ncbi:tol-pal system-associated acyl-CoA thioesterase [Burkholderiaceae bacterium FT117]|nr:tol-pal system-associated acyl-CoA thioesterase [Zeimonas sediminis]MCM5570310.1 tol-pal system-associated acyl-CoA thioesterase [Zeimonas sediminis]
MTAAANASRAAPDFTLRVRVYYEDTDAGGIVYHANWLRWFERARTDWLRALGVEHSRMLAETGVGFVVRDMSIDYRRPARLDEELLVDVRLVDARRASWTLAQHARRPGETEMLVGATLRIAAVHLASGRPTAIPRDLAERALARGARPNLLPNDE